MLQKGSKVIAPKDLLFRILEPLKVLSGQLFGYLGGLGNVGPCILSDNGLLGLSGSIGGLWAVVLCCALLGSRSSCLPSAAVLACPPARRFKQVDIQAPRLLKPKTRQTSQKCKTPDDMEVAQTFGTCVGRI